VGPLSKPRIDDEIVGVHFMDGSEVKKGDLLITLDTRALEAQLQQAEAMLARDKAQLEGSERDFRRYSDLVSRGATPQINLDNATTQSDTFRATIRADEAAVKALRVQLSYCEIRAPISGRISQASVKIGNFVRAADTTMPNEDELLWPGTIVTARITLRIEDAVVVPTTAVQVSPTGTYVYVVEDEVAFTRQVEVSRSTTDEMVIRSGLLGGESVVTDGHLLLSDRTPVKMAGP
jgi:multidrug efflux pump subunit AcrA (membrane-fusion protein)